MKEKEEKKEKIKKEKKQKKQNKKGLLSKIFLVIIGIILLLAVLFAVNQFKPRKTEKNTIIATKIEEYNGKKKKTTYKIKIENYEIANLTKEIKLPSKSAAETEYEAYKQIELYERKNIDMKLKGKKIICIIPKEQYQNELGYSEEDKEIMILSNDEQKEIVGQNGIINALQNQGYNIK